MIEKSNSLHSIFQNKKIFVFDSEALKKTLKNGNEFQKLYLGNIYSENENYYFYSLKEFNEIMQSLLIKYKRIMIFAHNLKYDLQLSGLLNYFIKNDTYLEMDKEDLLYGNVNYIKFQKKNKQKIMKSLEFNDTTNYFKTSLENIAVEMFKEKKYAHNEYKYKGKQWNDYIKKNGKELVLKDCEILYKLVNFMKNTNIKWGLSASNTTFKNWNYNYNPEYEIDTDKFNLIVSELYHGGRTEVYKRNQKIDAVSLDVNSLYPYVMKKYRYSVKFRRKLVINDYVTDYLIENIKKQKYNYIIFIDYKTQLSRTPIMTNCQGHLIDVQENLCYITGQEFLELYESDKNLSFKLYKVYEFFNNDLFSKYIDYFYKLKKEANNEAEKNIYKLFLNSLYGKMGQRVKSLKFLDYKDFPELKPFRKTNDLIRFNGISYSLYNDFLTMLEQQEYKYSPLISAEITANARIVNYQYQKKLGIENIIASDTDSFIIPKIEFEKIPNKEKIINNELGMLKIEEDKSGIVEFYGLKDYMNFTTNIRKIKGIRKNAIKINENKYSMEIFKILNRNEEIGIELEQRIKELTYDITKLKYNKENNGIIFKNYTEYLKKNKIKIPLNDRCIKK